MNIKTGGKVVGGADGWGATFSAILFRWRAFHYFQAKGEKRESEREEVSFCRRMDFVSFCLQFIRLFRCLLVLPPPLPVVHYEMRFDTFYLVGAS